MRGDDVGGPRTVRQIGLQKQAEQLLHKWVQMQTAPSPVKLEVVNWLQEKITGLSKNQALKAWANAAAVAWRNGGRGRVDLEAPPTPGLVNHASD